MQIYRERYCYEDLGGGFAKRRADLPLLPGCCTVGRTNMKSPRRVLGHSLIRSLVRSQQLVHSLAPNCSLRSGAPLRSFARSLAYSFAPELMGKRFMSMN